MRRILVFIMGLLGLGMLGYTCVYNTSDAIQYQLSQQIQKRLADEHFKYVELYVDGRNVLLQGKVTSAELKQQAESLAKVAGVYQFDSQIKLVEPLTTQRE